MREYNYRQIAVLFFEKSRNYLLVVYGIEIRVPERHKSQKFFFRSTSVPSVVVACDYISFGIEISCKIVVSVDMLDHSVKYLDYALGFAVGLPNSHRHFVIIVAEYCFGDFFHLSVPLYFYLYIHYIVYFKNFQPNLLCFLSASAEKAPPAPYSFHN